MGNSKLLASISYDRQGECPGPCDERRKFILAIAKWKLFKINFTVFHWEYIHCSTIIRTICLTRKRARIFKIHKRGDYELGCVISYELSFLCTVGRIRCFEVQELKMPFFCCTGKKNKQIEPQGSAGDRFLRYFLDSVTDLLPAISLPLLQTYKILHLLEVF